MEHLLEIYTPHKGKPSKNTDIGLHETVQAGKITKNTTNSVFKIQRQLFARSERVKGIDFHPVEPWILTTLYSGMFFGAWNIRIVVHANYLQAMSIYGHMRLRYASKIPPLASEHPLTSSRQ